MATLQDVAKLANVSKMTVSRVINHPEQVTDELQKLVYAAMKELNYQPNIAAKALVNNRSQIIKLFILEEIDTTEPYYMYLLLGIAKTLEKAHYALQVVTDPLVDFGSCDGYIITGFRKEDFSWVKELEKPVVLFGENEQGFDFVDSNNNYGTVMATNYAIECGYEHLIYVGIDVKEAFEMSRELGYQEVMGTLEKEEKIIRFPNRSTITEKYVKENWDKFLPNTCFICSSDRLALGLERGILAMGGSIPNDFGIIGFDGVFLDQVSSPKLTTLKQPVAKMGEVVGEMLVKKIESNGKSQGFRRFLPQLIKRESTRLKNR